MHGSYDTFRPEQNGRHFAGSIFLNENIWISNKISLKYIFEGLTDYKSTLVQVVA